MANQPIFITGEQRTGSSWIAQILATAAKTAWLDEPFNRKKPSVWLCEGRFSNWYTHIGRHNEAIFRQPIADTLAFRFNWLAHWRRATSLAHWRRAWQVGQQFRGYRQGGFRPLIKQPTGLFMAEWLANNFQAQVVVIVRHPAGYVSSRKRLGWRHNFNDFLDQPALMAGLLAPFAADIAHFAAREEAVVAQLALLWKIIFATADHYRQTQPKWLFLRYEDVAADPETQFRQLFAQLGLTFTVQTGQLIRQSSQAANPEEVAVQDWKSVQRNSQAAATTWKTRLNSQEIDQIRAVVGEVGQIFYKDDEW